MEKNQAAVELGKKGGLKTKKKHGKEFYKEIGKLGRQKQLDDRKKAQNAKK